MKIANPFGIRFCVPDGSGQTKLYREQKFMLTYGCPDSSSHLTLKDGESWMIRWISMVALLPFESCQLGNIVKTWHNLQS